ncbi:MAG TPA: cytochrome b N-terminal domain-containing protein [Polyangiaceae bacterium]|jgi:ubiquinol-cytochrome c reductase cytochrome b subunit|nr:cytochrome b N-terminal domain-containing protein [Polyangiaceae bacterium]
MSRLGDWLDDRIGFGRRMKAMLEHPIAGGPSWARSVGFTLVFLLVTLVATGVALMTTYAPTVEAAWASVHFTTYVMPHGWLLRGLHHFAGEAMLVLAATHVAMLAVGGGHRRPREIGFLASVFATGAIAAACVTGGVLPWDQQGYWARRVEIGIAQMGPGGVDIARFVQGGPDLGQLGLTRMYAAHVIVLPLLVAALFRLRRRSEWTFGEKIAARHNTGFESYIPRQLARDLALAASVALLVGYMTNKVHGASLDAPADPASDYPARPEWFLMWLYEVRRHVHGRMEFWGTLGVPFAIGLVFVALPWLDKKLHGASVIGAIAVLLAAGAIGGLTYASMDRDAHDAKFQKAHADARKRANVAIALAKKGVPPAGPLVMLRDDPELRAHALFTEKCSSCHLLGDMGDKKKADAPALDGWSTEAWLVSILHDPDADDRFGRTPYKGNMPSMDVAPKDDTGDFKPMSKDDMTSVAKFFASGEGDAGEKIIKDRCTTCHVYNGEGDDNGEGSAPELAGYGTLPWLRAQIADPSTPATYRKNALGKHHMPKFDGDIPAADIDLLARFTLAKARGLPFP